MLRRAALHAFGAPASMACRARPCFFLHGRSTSFVLFPVVRAADSWRKRMRNAFEPLRFQANGSCSTWIRATIWSSCRHMLRAAAVQVCRADAFRRAILPARSTGCSRHVPSWVFCCVPWSGAPTGCPAASPSLSPPSFIGSSPLLFGFASSLLLAPSWTICFCLIFGPNRQLFGTNLRLCTMENALFPLAINRDLGFC